MEILFYICFVYLVFLSIEDIRKMQIDNGLIAVLFITAFIYQVVKGNILPVAIGIILFGILAYVLYSKECIGGADAKLLFAIVPCLSIKGIPNMLVTLWMFIIIFGILALIYAKMFERLFPKIQIVPFVPIITLSYVLIWIYRIS